MRSYYYIENDERKGPFSLDELKEKFIFSDTMILKSGLDHWTRADELLELEGIIKKKHPDNNQNISKGQKAIIPEEFDYATLEDTAGVDYKKAMIFTIIYIVINIFFREYAVLGQLGIFISTGLVVTVWIYFKKYFDAVGDKGTGLWIWGMVAAYVIFGFVSYQAAENASFSNFDMYKKSNRVGLLNLIENGRDLSIFVILLSGIKLFLVNKKHALPLRWIAISSVIIIPVYIFGTIRENMAAFNELNTFFGWFGGREPERMGIGQLFLLMTPYFLLLYHFYRAETEDAT